MIVARTTIYYTAHQYNSFIIIVDNFVMNAGRAKNRLKSFYSISTNDHDDTENQHIVINYNNCIYYYYFCGHKY